MSRVWILIIAVLCLASPIFGQVSTVTGQAIDQDSQAWFSGSYQIQFVNSQPGTVAYRKDTLQPFPASFQGTLDSTGSFSVTLTRTDYIIPANSLWKFTICSAVTGWSCYSFTIPIAATVVSVTANISAVIKAPRVTGGPGISAYQDIEVAAFPNNSYFNLTLQQNRCFTTVWGTCGGGGSSGVTSLNGQTGAQSLVPGNGILITPNGSNQITVTATGAAGSGNVASGNIGAYGGYFPAGNTIVPTANSFVSYSMTLSQINAIFTGTPCPNGEVFILPGSPQYPWTNAGKCGVRDFRKGAEWLFPAAYGITCDANQLYLSIAQGATQVTTNADVVSPGATFIFSSQGGYGYGAVQQVWAPLATSFSFPTMQLNGAAPFAYTGWVTTGTDNTAALNAAFADASYIFPLRLPAGCNVLTQATTWTGTPIAGMQLIGSIFTGFPGQDIIQATAAGADQNGVGLSDMTFTLDSSIDPTLGWRNWNQAGTSYATVPPVYRPTLNNTPDANRPLSDQWVTAGSNGVASITAGSAVICISNALGRTPPNGNMILFPYLSSVLFEATVVNQTGAGCGTGFTGLTLNSTVPGGATQAQAYYETGTAFEVGQTNIPATGITYPLTVTVSLPNAPDPNGFSAPWGHFIIGNNSARFEADYMGNNYSATAGAGTFILQRGPSTTGGSALTGGAYWIVPANPCKADFENPPPVVPNINGGNAMTPTNAADIPGGCVGNAAISFPEPDGTSPSPGTVNAFFQRLFFDNTSNSVAQGNNGAAFYAQGNTMGYSDLLDSFKIGGLTYGIVTGPASTNNWGISAVGPTAAGDTISNCEIHAAFPLVLSYFGQGKVDRCDTYTSLINPYNGSVQGAATAIATSYQTNEQTGTGASQPGCFEFSLNNWNSEPEAGYPAVVVFPYSYINCAGYNLLEDNFEGSYQIFSGSNGLIQNTFLSVPVINNGINNKFENVFGLSASYMTNNWADNTNQFFNWGALSSGSCSFGTGGTFGNCGVGFMQEWNGHDFYASLSGADNGGNVENPLGGVIEPYERPGMGPVVYDSTEPYWGKYTTCFLGSGNECIIREPDGFNGAVYIGGHNRIATAAYTLEMNVKSPLGANSAYVYFGALGTGCPNEFQHSPFTTTSGWTHKSIPVSFVGMAGCTLQLVFDSGASNDLFQFGEINFVPQIQTQTITPPADSIYHTACPVNGRYYGISSTGYAYACVNGTINRSGPYN